MYSKERLDSYRITSVMKVQILQRHARALLLIVGAGIFPQNFVIALKFHNVKFFREIYSQLGLGIRSPSLRRTKLRNEMKRPELRHTNNQLPMKFSIACFKQIRTSCYCIYSQYKNEAGPIERRWKKQNRNSIVLEYVAKLGFLGSP